MDLLSTIVCSEQRKSGNLPIGPVTDNTFDHLSPLDLIHFSRTNRQSYAAVADYIIHAFSITDLLGRYFSAPDVLAFRFLQAQTGAVISGSSALQFFGRVVYPESDLDAYVYAERAEPIMCWLKYAGYKLLDDPLEGRFPSLDQKLDRLDRKMERTRRMFKDSLEDSGEFYRNRCMLKVYNFQRRADPTKKIQLILTYNNPLELILSFHSTCVMNVITHDTAYSLFPYATFEQKVSLVIEKSRDDNCFEKYRNRGWTILDRVPPTEAHDPKSDFYAPSRIEGRGVVRFVGDRRCWTIPLSPKMGGTKPEFMRHMNSWQLIHDASPNALGTDTKFKILRSKILGNSYTVALRPAIFLEPILSALEYHVGRRLDRDVENLLRLYFESFNEPE